MACYPIHFTLAEARATLPELRRQLLRINDLLAELQAESERTGRPSPIIVRGNGKGPIVTEATGSVKEEAQRLIKAIAVRGIQIKDVKQGLVDFPHFLGGNPAREVFLCWYLGEDTIAFWHTIDAGYSGRRPIVAGTADQRPGM